MYYFKRQKAKDKETNVHVQADRSEPNSQNDSIVDTAAASPEPDSDSPSGTETASLGKATLILTFAFLFATLSGISGTCGTESCWAGTDAAPPAASPAASAPPEKASETTSNSTNSATNPATNRAVNQATTNPTTEQAADFAAAMETFRRLPVLTSGRVQPLNTVAVTTVKTLCGSVQPVFSIEGLNLPPEISAESTTRIVRYFANGTQRQFSAPELYWYWLTEPEVWEHIPFLECKNADLRKLLNVPLQGAQGQKLRYVSPYHVADRQPLSEYRYNMATRQQQERRQGITHQQTSLEKAVEKLIQNFEAYRALTFYPPAAENSREPTAPLATRILQSWMMDLSRPMGQKVQGKSELIEAVGNLDKYGESLRKLFLADPNSEDRGKLDRSLGAFTHLIDLYQKEVTRLIVYLEDMGKDLDAAENAKKENAKSVNVNTANATGGTNNPSGAAINDDGKIQTDDFPGIHSPQADLNASSGQLLRKMKRLQNDLRQLRYKLYDEGGQAGWVPSLNPESVDIWRNLEDSPSVWINLATLLYGDDQVLAGYKPASIAKFRQAWANAALQTTTWNPADQEKAPRLAEAMNQVKTELKNLAAEGDRRNRLWEADRLDQDVINHSKYPADDRYAANELFYYDVNPFVKSWILAAIAVLLLAMEQPFNLLHRWGTKRDEPDRNAESAIGTTLFWLGFGALAVALVFNLIGLGLRGWIMSRSPIANMFETIAFVAFCSGIIGIWFTLKPILSERLRKAWSMSGTNWGLQIPRLCFAVILFYVLVFVSYGAGNGYSAVELIPRRSVGAVLPTVSDFLVWLSSIGLLVSVVWLLPRLAVTLLAAPFVGSDNRAISPRATACGHSSALTSRQTSSEEPQKTSIGRAQLFCAALMVFVLTLGASKAPMFNDDLKNLMPILRDNFWLAIHVISIVGGYGSAMLAWILGNAALVWFAIGRYAPCSAPSASPNQPNQQTARVPILCESLSEAMYTCIKATIWLLAIGIILGGLWADVSWGRFWSWDRKEVWALISLFIYLVFVHARHWGWFRRNRALTLTLGSVVGALSILMAWYGVNYLLGSTMHGYASGSGGLAPAIAFFCANVAFATLAVVRYVNENRQTTN